MINPLSYTDIVVKTLSEVDLLLKDYIFNGYSALASFLRLPIGIILSIYIALFGYSIAIGWVQLEFKHFIKTTLKIGFVYTAATQWGWVSDYFINLVNGAVNGIGDALISASPVPISGVDGINGAMQLVLIEFTNLGAVVFQTGGLGNFAGLLDGIILWLFGYLLVALALFELIVAKIMLAVLFVFTPMIMCFYLFTSLKGVFDRWLSAIVSAALLQLLVTAALTFALSLAYWWLDLHYDDKALQLGNFGTLPVIILGVISIGLIYKAANLAYYLGGAITSTNYSSLATGLFAGYLGSQLTTSKQQHLSNRFATQPRSKHNSTNNNQRSLQQGK